MVKYKLVDGAKDQFDFFSDSAISSIYIEHPDPNVQYKFMMWNISEDKKQCLMYNNGLDGGLYQVVVVMEDNTTCKFEIYL